MFYFLDNVCSNSCTRSLLIVTEILVKPQTIVSLSHYLSLSAKLFLVFVMSKSVSSGCLWSCVSLSVSVHLCLLNCLTVLTVLTHQSVHFPTCWAKVAKIIHCFHQLQRELLIGQNKHFEDVTLDYVCLCLWWAFSAVLQNIWLIY